jgi:hypothetical protein
MNRLVLCIAASLVFAIGGVARGLDCGRGCCGPCWCPDNYCPKPCPYVCLPATCGCCDDYCAKPLPCICLPATCGCCDDYCPKPLPCVSWPCCWPESYRCPPCGR